MVLCGRLSVCEHNIIVPLQCDLPKHKGISDLQPAHTRRLPVNFNDAQLKSNVGEHHCGICRSKSSFGKKTERF